jgi:hypothetical protein
MMEATSAARAWLIRPDNIPEMDDQFYTWVRYFSFSPTYAHESLASD